MPFKSILLLGFYHPRYLKPLRKWGEEFAKHGFTVTPLLADAHYKSEVLSHLQKPYDLVIYFGHGEPGRFCGYRGVSQQELPTQAKRQPRTILALCCSSLDKKRSKSIAETFISTKLAERVIGYENKVSFVNNKALLEQICKNLIKRNELKNSKIETMAQQCGITNLGIISKNN